MAEEKPSDKQSAAENFGNMLKEFGSAVAEIFNDPELKNKAREFGESAKESAKTFASRFRDEEVKGKFKDVGSAAHDFGESVSDYFRGEKGKNEDSKNEDSKNESTQNDSWRGEDLKKESQGMDQKADEDFKNGSAEDGTSKGEDLNNDPADIRASSGEELINKPVDEVTSEDDVLKKKLNENSYTQSTIKSEEEKNSKTKENQSTKCDPLGKGDFKKSSNEFDGRFDNYFKSPRAGRITGYVFAVIFSIAWLIFVNYFYRLIAFYNFTTTNGIETVKIAAIFTDNIKYWLPFFTISIAVSILGNIFLIIYERFYLVKIIAIISGLFFAAATATLLQLFPFDFSGIPLAGLRAAAPSITIAVLVIIIVGTGIGVISDFIKLAVFFARSGSTKE